MSESILEDENKLLNIPDKLIMVMLVDDQPFVGESVRRQLADEADINFHYCANPIEAINTAESIKPTVILLDLVMPDIDGLTLCRFLRKHPNCKDIPVIMLSSTEEASVKAQAFGAGANDYLIKLPDKVELIARLRYHSDAYIGKLQRDAAYLALRASQLKLEELNIQLLKLANQDGLTQLTNRRHFDECYIEEWSRAQRNQSPLSLIMLDVDHFKQFNDRHGHLEGDDCLKKVAKTAKDIIKRPADVIARYGGEEFIVLLPETDLSGALKIAEHMREAVLDLKIPHGAANSPFVTVSLGAASTLPLDKNPYALVKFADECLYQAKASGRNRVHSGCL